MKKTLAAVACAALISTGAYAKPASNHAPKPNNNHSVHMTNSTHHSGKPTKHASHHSAPVTHVVHHSSAPVVAHVGPTPHHHHHHNHLDLGDALIAFAILAAAF